MSVRIDRLLEATTRPPAHLIDYRVQFLVSYSNFCSFLHCRADNQAHEPNHVDRKKSVQDAIPAQNRSIPDIVPRERKDKLLKLLQSKVLRKLASRTALRTKAA
jgi:hypothetical protein